jgi:hypothetical protein
MTVPVIALLLFGTRAAAAQPHQPASATSTAEAQVTVSEFGPRATLRNQNYDFVTLANHDGSWTHLLVHRQQDIVRDTGLEGYVRQELSAEVWEVTGATKKSRFRLRETASSSSIDQGLLIANNFGCCDSSDTHAVYSLWSGKRLFFAGGDRDPYVLRAVWPNQPRERLVGVHVSGSSRDAEIYPNDKRDRAPARMMITLADRDEPLDRIVIRLPGDRESRRLRTVGWSGEPKDGASRILQVWPPKVGQPPVAPRISLELTTGETIELPIEDKQFALNRASAPTGAKIDRIAPR